MTTHDLYLHEVQVPPDDGDAWQAVCSCGWHSRPARFDMFATHPDPAQAAADYAQILGEFHLKRTADGEALRLAYEAADGAYTATVRVGMDLHAARDYTDNAVRKLRQLPVSPALELQASALLAALAETCAANRQEQDRLAAVASAAYNEWNASIPRT